MTRHDVIECMRGHVRQATHEIGILMARKPHHPWSIGPWADALASAQVRLTRAQATIMVLSGNPIVTYNVILDRDPTPVG